MFNINSNVLVMEFQGTKGKWMCTNMVTVWCKVGGNTKTIVNCNNSSLTDNENYHNALLISKAPEMLEMLKIVYDSINMQSEIEYCSETYYKIEQLIKEATEL